MVENKDMQPPFPQFSNCECPIQNCAQKGCYFERVINNVNSEKFGKIEAKNTIEGLITLAEQCGCKNLENLIKWNF